MPFEETKSSSPKGEKVTVVGSFKIGRLLGKGSFCKVKLATHLISGQQVCLFSHLLFFGIIVHTMLVCSEDYKGCCIYKVVRHRA